MGQLSVNDLPVELHTLILDHLYRSSSRFGQRYLDDSDDEEDNSITARMLRNRRRRDEWRKEDPYSPSLFPFNVALAWRLWRDILAQIPECWTRIVFDLAQDPAQLLDAFEWSQGLTGLEIVVHNTIPDSHIPNANCEEESQRISAIISALFPHIFRCRSINFKTIFSTSLPPPNFFLLRKAPLLKELILDCRVNNLSLEVVSTITRQQRLYSSFPLLKKLSLTGFWFIYLVQIAQGGLGWLSQLELQRFGSLSISHFAFPRPELSPEEEANTGKASYSLETFVGYISVMQTLSDLHLHDLSLQYDFPPSNVPPDESYRVPFRLHFHSVSKSFLSHFDYLVYVERPCQTASRNLTLEGCELPVGLRQIIESVESLTLERIVDMDGSSGAGLREILLHWRGTKLKVVDSPLFDDNLLRWLADAQEHPDSVAEEDADDKVYTLAAAPLRSLLVVNCPGISARALADFLHHRECNLALATALQQYRLDEVEVRGRGLPHLTEEDKDALRDVGGLWDARVTWTDVGEDGKSVYQFFNYR